MSQPKRASEFVLSLMKDLRSKRAYSPVADALDLALGERLAGHCKVAGFAGGKLWVEVDSAPLFAELRGFRSEELREAINRHLGAVKQRVAQIVFRMGGTGHA